MRRLDRLRQVLQVPRAQRACPLLGACVGGEGDGRDAQPALGGQRPELLDEDVAVLPGKPDVAHHDVGEPVIDGGEGRADGRRGAHLGAGPGEHDRDRLPPVCVVIDHEGT